MRSTSAAGEKTSINAVQQSLVVSMPARLSADTLQAAQEEILERLQAASIRAVIFDMALAGAIDSREFSALADTARMVQIMGTPAIFSGFQAGAVSALLDLDVDTKGIVTVRGVDDAFDLLECVEPCVPDNGPMEDSGVIGPSMAGEI